MKVKQMNPNMRSRQIWFNVWAAARVVQLLFERKKSKNKYKNQLPTKYDEKYHISLLYNVFLIVIHCVQG